MLVISRNVNLDLVGFIETVREGLLLHRARGTSWFDSLLRWLSLPEDPRQPDILLTSVRNLIVLHSFEK